MKNFEDYYKEFEAKTNKNYYQTLIDGAQSQHNYIEASLIIISSEMGCIPTKAKEYYLNNLSIFDAYSLMNKEQGKSFKEAIELGVDTHQTPSVIKLKWINEHIYASLSGGEPNTENDLIDLLKILPDAEKYILALKHDDLIYYFTQKDGIIKNWVESIACLKANILPQFQEVDRLFIDGDFYNSIKAIDTVIDNCQNDFISIALMKKGLILKKIDKNRQALFEFNNALEMLDIKTQNYKKIYSQILYNQGLLKMKLYFPDEEVRKDINHSSIMNKWHTDQLYDELKVILKPDIGLW